MFVVRKDESQILQINISNEYSNDYFLFALSGNGLEEQKLFFATPDYSKSPRVVFFDITEDAVEDVMNGIISIPRPGDLYCAIYNVATETLTIPSDEPIWRGLFRVYDSSTTTNKNTISINYYGYDPR